MSILERDFETLTATQASPGVIAITLNRPDSHNAVDRTMHHELLEAFHAFHAEPDLGAVVLAGNGPTFCAGGSMQMIQDFAVDDYRRTIRTLEQGVRLALELLQIGPPVVAAVRGNAMGLGATMALLCDVIVVGESTRIADTHVRAGIVAGDGGTLIWPAVLGPARAKELLMTGRALSATEAERVGLVNHVVPDAEVADRALAIAMELAAGPRQAIVWTKQVVNNSLLREAMAQLPLAISLEARTMLQPDMTEGTQAFLNRRTPKWPSTEPEAAR